MLSNEDRDRERAGRLWANWGIREKREVLPLGRYFGVAKLGFFFFSDHPTFLHLKRLIQILGR